MPKRKPDALDQVLKDYGIDPEYMPAMRKAILDGTASISKEALTHAAQNVAGDEQNRLQAMTAMANATKNREVDPVFYQQLVGEPGRRGIQREAAAIAKSADHAARFDLQNAADNELLRLASMTDYLGDLRQEPGTGAVTSNFREPGPEMLGLIPLEPNMRRTVGPAPVPPPGPVTPPNEGGLSRPLAPDPYQARLERARQLRATILGAQAVGQFTDEEEASRAGRLLENK